MAMVVVNLTLATSTSMETPIEDRIIEELRKGDRQGGDLKDSLEIERYPELWAAIALLVKQGKIQHYFKDDSPSSPLVYRLVRQPAFSSPILPWGSRR